MDPTFAWGTAYDDQDARVLGSMRAQRLHAACVAHRDFDVVELRYCDLPNVGRCDVIVARCTNQEVPSHNTVGIKVVEILALAVPVGDHAPRVVALRRCFPLVSHLNEIVPGGPKSLCISDESWNDARRTWTPQRFLAGVLRWLTRTARGTLHAPDQPVERIYFESPLEVVLPAGYSGEGPANTRLVMSEVPRGQGRTFVASYKTDEDAGRVEVLPIYMEVERLHGVVDSVPVTLGELEDQWAARGTPIASRLVEKLARLAGGGIIDVLGQGLLLILDIGIVREAGTSAERREHIGFLIEQSLASLAHEMGAVFRSNRMHFAPSEPDPEAAQKSAEAWRPIRMLPVDVKAALTRSQAREQAGIDAQGA